MTQHKDRKSRIRARMAATGEPYTQAARHVDAGTAAPGGRYEWRSQWINPPRHDDPYEHIVIELSQPEAAAVTRALDEAARWAGSDKDAETARLLGNMALDIKSAMLTPAAADRAGMSREATWHPANSMQRMIVTALRNTCRYLSPMAIAAKAIETAAAIAWSQGGQEAKDQVLDHCWRVIENAAGTTYPDARRRTPAAPAGLDPGAKAAVVDGERITWCAECGQVTGGGCVHCAQTVCLDCSENGRHACPGLNG